MVRYFLAVCGLTPARFATWYAVGSAIPSARSSRTARWTTSRARCFLAKAAGATLSSARSMVIIQFPIRNFMRYPYCKSVDLHYYNTFPSTLSPFPITEGGSLTDIFFPHILDTEKKHPSRSICQGWRSHAKRLSLTNTRGDVCL